MILIAFFGNFLVNNVAAALAALVPASPNVNPLLSAQYITFVVLAAVTAGIMAWWYLARLPREGGLAQGAIFGVVGFLITVITAFVTGIASVLLQTGTLAQIGQILPHFGPYLMQWTTLILLCLWVIPGILVGWMMQMRMQGPAAQSMSMGGGTM